jgi:hypothetical protein
LEDLQSIGEQLAAEIIEIANRRPAYDDRDASLAAAREIIAQTGAASACEIAWAILCCVARQQARAPPTRRLTWRTTMIRRPAEPHSSRP